MKVLTVYASRPEIVLSRRLRAPLLVRTTPLPSGTRVAILATLACGGLALLVATRRTGTAH